MSEVLAPRMSRAAFLAWDATQEERWEFDGVAPVAMTGGTRAHATIARNLGGLLWQAPRATTCGSFGGDLRIGTATSIRYPDAAVSCTPAESGDLALRDPVTVFEVLSPSTAATDLVAKAVEYRSVPSIRRYVVLSEDRIAATVFVRIDADWIARIVEGADAVLDMPEIGVRLRLGDLYEGVVA